MAKKPEDDDIEITDDDIKALGGNTPAADGDLPVEDASGGPADPAYEASESMKEEIAALKKLNEEADAARAAAEARVTEERRGREADAAKYAKTETELKDTRLDTITNALSANELSVKDAKGRYASAMQEGDFAKAADVQAEMSDLSVKKQRLEEGRNAIELQIEQAADAPAQPARAPTIDDWFETLPSTQRDWAKGHREWFTTPAKNAKVMAAHWEAVEDNGIREGSPQYFDFIETRLGLKQHADDDGQGGEIPARTERRPQNAPAAPVSRGAPSMSSGNRQSNGNRFRLTGAQAEAAQISGLSSVEYYKALTPEEQAVARSRVN